MWKILSCLLTIALLLPAPASAASPADFYKGKSIRIVVGFSAGGGFDTYARVITRHMGKHVPGQPAFLVENMAGAGTSRQRAKAFFAAPTALSASPASDAGKRPTKSLRSAGLRFSKVRPDNAPSQRPSM